MAIERINYGAAPDDGTGDPLRTAFRKTDDNFNDLETRKAEEQDVAYALARKQDAQPGMGLSQESYTTAEKNKLAGVADNATHNRPDSETATVSDLALKQDKEVGAGLITDAEKNKLAGVADNATHNRPDSETDDALALKADKTAVAQDITDAKNRSNHTGPLNWAWAAYGGTTNAVTLTPAFTRTAYATGDEFRFRATASNTGATTINVNGLGEKAAVTVTGAALPAGYIRTGVDTVCVYDGTKFVVQREVEVGSNANGRYVKEACGTVNTFVAKTGYTAGTTFHQLPVPVVEEGSSFAGVSVEPNIIAADGYDVLCWASGQSVGTFHSVASGNNIVVHFNGRWY